MNSNSNIREVDLAWAAGIIDGEGHIGIGAKHPPSGNKSYKFVPVLSVAMTHYNTLLRLHQIFGVGNLGKPRQTSKNSNFCYVWRVSYSRVYEILGKIRPYMVTKAKHADLVMEFAAKKFSLDNKMISNEETEHGILFYRQIRELNIRGSEDIKNKHREEIESTIAEIRSMHNKRVSFNSGEYGSEVLREVIPYGVNILGMRVAEIARELRMSQASIYNYLNLPKDTNKCRRGHEFSDDNTVYYNNKKGTARTCKECKKLKENSYYQKNKEKLRAYSRERYAAARKIKQYYGTEPNLDLFS